MNEKTRLYTEYVEMFEQIEGVKINEEEESGAMLAFQELWWLA